MLGAILFYSYFSDLLLNNLFYFLIYFSLLILLNVPLSLISGEGGRGTKRRRKAEETDSSDDGSDEERPRKRGRPRVTPRENIKGFTDQEVCILH